MLLLLLRGVVHIIAPLLLVATATAAKLVLLLLLTVAWLLLLLRILLRPSVITGLFLAGRFPEVLSLLLGVWLGAPLATLILLLLLRATVLALTGKSILIRCWLITAKNVELLSTTRVIRNFH